MSDDYYPVFNHHIKDDSLSVSLARMEFVPAGAPVGSGIPLKRQEIKLYCIGSGRNQREAKAAAIRNIRRILQQVRELPESIGIDFQI